MVDIYRMSLEEYIRNKYEKLPLGRKTKWLWDRGGRKSTFYQIPSCTF